MKTLKKVLSGLMILSIFTGGTSFGAVEEPSENLKIQYENMKIESGDTDEKRDSKKINKDKEAQRQKSEKQDRSEADKEKAVEKLGKEKYIVEEQEPNDWPYMANSMNLDHYVSGTITDYYYDLDYYKFSLDQSGTLDVVGFFQNSYYVQDSYDLTIGIEDSEGNLIGFSYYNWEGDFQGISFNLEAGDYYLVVFQSSDYQYLYLDETYFMGAEFSPDGGENQEEIGPVETPETPETPVIPGDGKTVYRALLIGNSDYPGYYQDLAGPVIDITRMRKVLESSAFGAEDSKFIHIESVEDAGKQETIDSIKSAFKGSDSDDISYFYYSGHGSSDMYSGEVSICPVDQNMGVRELESELSKISGTKVVMIDACYSGGFIDQNRVSKDSSSAENQKIIEAFSNRHSKPKSLSDTEYRVITASTYDELSYESNSDSLIGYGGDFTNQFVKGAGFIDGYYPANLDEDSRVTLGETYDYTRANVKMSSVQFYPSGARDFEIIGLEDEGVQAEGLELSRNEVTLEVGETAKLEATIYPENASNKDVQWASDDESKATVDSDGNITALSYGDVEINCSTSDGSIVKKCLVKVRREEVKSYQEWNGGNVPTVTADKVWTVGFSKKIGNTGGISEKVYVTDQYENIISTEVKLLEGGKKLQIAPVSSYNQGGIYRLYISGDVYSEENEKLKQDGMVMSFTVN